jgi:hypothetical protein
MWCRKLNRPLPLPAFTLLSPRYIHQDPVMNHLPAAAHERRTTAEDDKVASLLLLDDGEPFFYARA